MEGFIQPDSARLDQIIEDYFVQKEKEWVQGFWGASGGLLAGGLLRPNGFKLPGWLRLGPVLGL